MKLNITLTVAIFALLFSSISYAAGWRGVHVYGKYVKEGDGWRTIGEVGRLTDADTDEFVGFSYYRKFRHYFILQNHGQPMIEAWDFPLNCSEAECPDSKLARVTFFPYKDAEMLGELSGALDKEDGVFRFKIADKEFLTLDAETMNIVGGVVREDLSHMPKPLVDPAVFCSEAVTCIRSLAFGRLAHEDLRPSARSKVFMRSPNGVTVPNVLVYLSRPEDFANPARFSTESSLIDAVRRFMDGH